MLLASAMCPSTVIGMIRGSVWHLFVRRPIGVDESLSTRSECEVRGCRILRRKGPRSSCCRSNRRGHQHQAAVRSHLKAKIQRVDAAQARSNTRKKQCLKRTHISEELAAHIALFSCNNTLGSRPIQIPPLCACVGENRRAHARSCNE